MCTNCQKNNCGCQPELTFSLCNPLCPPEPCTCPVSDLSTDCIVLAQDLECSGVLAGTIFTEAVQQLDEYICTAIAELIASINLVNVGTGAQIYKGVDGIGRKELKSITSNGSVTILENTNDIQLSVPIIDGSETKINPGTNISITGIGTTATPYVINNTLNVDGSETKLTAGTNIGLTGNGTVTTPYVIANTLTINGSETKITNGTNTTVTGNGTIATPYQIAVDGSETKVNAGTNVTITGNGTTATPYIINSTAAGASTVINAGTNISVTGAGTSGSPFVISNTQVIDGSETKLNSGITTVVTGNGTTATPYTVETVNLQKAITANYTILAADNNYSIKINNGATPITITVPAGLPANFFAGFTQKGTADVTFVGSGTTITNPIGLKIKGQGYAVGLEQIGTSNSFDLIADTKA